MSDDREDQHLISYSGDFSSRYAGFNEKWGRTLVPVLAVALAVSVVLVIVFASLYGAKSDDNNSPGGGLVASCSVPFAQPTQAWLATMRQRLRQRLLSPAVWQTEAGGEPEGVVLVMGLSLSYRNDVELYFFQETNFLYLTGVNEPGYSALLDVASGNTTLFMPVRDRNYAIWSGRVLTPDEVKTKYGVDQVLPANQIADALYNVTKQSTLSVYTLPATAQQPFLANFTVNTAVLSKALAFARPVKSAEEIALLRISSNVSATAHIKLMETVKAGIYEYNVDGLFVNLCYGCGLAYQAYKPIVGAGESSAILHYRDNNAQLKDGQIILIDAAGAYLGYASDITRTYPVNGRWTSDQTLIYTMVSDVQAKGLSMMVPGANYSVLTSGLRSYFNEVLLREGFVKGDLAALNANSISSYFCPHGFSHHVGLDVHDPGDFGIFKPGYVLTMEPGLYFMEALLVPALNNNTIAGYLVKDKIQHFLDSKFGGVRIEDVVLITEDGNDVISDAVPKSIDAIERIMRH